ncbi:hypothetical protein COCCADRAFT_88477 [Bipolaris zeicola 26-R-13]|uniref:Uncharacterized protein n=1 Tax=Cochliobolus carbonum (strain 26-R-13) TaxID=930089 RepID=W6YKX8_COCC2|nr:uncharacterized protein COCCADRAFT_88477 [Bipolaris zeicola 26-R-13]EUC36314.1 hypothetical protein COCCADRAFT_88477 [Bipolaris zeicola 26-R-13]
MRQVSLSFVPRPTSLRPSLTSTPPPSTLRLSQILPALSFLLELPFLSYPF